jgi:hypothetical protein
MASFSNQAAAEFLYANKDNPQAIIEAAQANGINNPDMLADLINRVAPDLYGAPISGADVMYAYNNPRPQQQAPAQQQPQQQSLQQMASAPQQQQPQAQPPSFEQYLQSMGVTQDEGGNFVGPDGRRIHEDNLQGIHASYQQAMAADQYGRNPYGTNLNTASGAGYLANQSGVTDQSRFTGQDGQSYFRTGFSQEDMQKMLADPQGYINSLGGVDEYKKQQMQYMMPYMQEFAKQGGKMEYSPEQGYYTDANLYDKVVGQGVQGMPDFDGYWKGSPFEAFSKTIGPAMGLSSLAAWGLGSLGGSAAGFMPEGYQSLLSSLSQNAASQGGSWGDLMSRFGFGGDAAYGANPMGVHPDLYGSMTQEGSIWNDLYEQYAGQGQLDPTVWRNIGRMYNPLDEIDLMDAAVNLTGASSFPAAVSQLGFDNADSFMKQFGNFSTALVPAAGAALNGLGNASSGGNGNGGSVNGPTSGGNGAQLPWQQALMAGLPNLLNAAGGLGSFLQGQSLEDMFKKLSQEAADRTDPFGKERPFYQNMLRQSYTDPNFFNSNPVFKGMQDEAGRRTQASMASQGFNQSGNMLHEVARTAVDTGHKFAQPFQQQLGINAGANIGPGYAGFLQQQGGQNAAQAQTDGLASLFTGLGQLATFANN